MTECKGNLRTPPETVYAGRHRLVYLLNWRASIERLIRSLEVIVMDERRKSLADEELMVKPNDKHSVVDF